MERIHDIGKKNDIFMQKRKFDEGIYFHSIIASPLLKIEKLEDIARHSRRKSIAYKIDSHPSLIPLSINTVDKIISKWKGRVDDKLLNTLKHLPNKSLKLSRLPPKVLETLEMQNLVEYPQNFGDVILEYKKELKVDNSAISLRITNNNATVTSEESDDTDSSLKSEIEVSSKEVENLRKEVGINKFSKSSSLGFGPGKCLA